LSIVKLFVCYANDKIFTDTTSVYAFAYLSLIRHLTLYARDTRESTSLDKIIWNNNSTLEFYYWKME